MITFKTKQTLAFGNGTRVAGFEFGKVKDVNVALECARMREKDFSKFGCELNKDDEVTEAEVRLALQNSHCLVFGDEASQDDVDSEVGSGGGSGGAAGAGSKDWRAITIDSLEDVHKDTATALAGAKPPVTTLGELFDFGEANKGFTTIDGIGKATEEKLSAALRSAIEASQNEDDSEGGSGDE